MKTRPRSIKYIFSSGGKLNTDQLDTDVAALKEKYYSQGYMDVTILPPRLDRVGEKVDVTFVLHEGPQYHVGKVVYNGAKVFTVEEATKKAQIKTGNIYSPQAVRADVKAIQDL